MATIKTSRVDSTPYSADRFLADLRSTAAAIEAPFDESMTSRLLDVFDSELRQSVVQMKATCQSGSGLYYRFFYKWDRDLTRLAQDSGFIPNESTPIVDLQAEVLESCPGATRAGLDLESEFGLAKVWTFTGGPVPLDEIVKLRTIPQAVRDQRDFLVRHGMRHVFFVASDFQRQSMNVYFGLEDDCRNEQWLRQLLKETGGEPEDPALYPAMLASLAVSAGIGTTFYWDRPEMGRWCLYGLNIPCDDAAVIGKIPAIPSRLQTFQIRASSLNAEPQYNLAWSFGQAGFYTKMEKSYARDADHFLTVEMGGDLTNRLNQTAGSTTDL